jgi:hypothetical protein
MKRSNFRLSATQWAAIAILASSAGLSLAVTLPNTFIAGAPARAEDVNANFAALKAAVDALEDKVKNLGANPPLASRNGKMAYAWLDQPTSASYTPDAGFAFNSSGGSVTVTRSGVGSYSVSFAGLSPTNAGNVSAYLSNHTCNTMPWRAVNGNVVISLRCVDQSGAPADSYATVLFVD